MVICGGKGLRRCNVETHGGGAREPFFIRIFFFILNFVLQVRADLYL